LKPGEHILLISWLLFCLTSKPSVVGFLLYSSFL